MGTKLAVWKTLKKGGRLHFLLGNSKRVRRDVSLTHKGSVVEIYEVSQPRILLLDILEFLCGYKRYKLAEFYIYLK